MSQNITLTLDDTLTEDDLKDLVQEIRSIPGVDGARGLEQRAIDVAGILVLLKVAASVLTVAKSAWELVEKLRGALKAKGIERAVLTLPTGTKIELQNATPEQIERLLQKAAPSSV